MTRIAAALAALFLFALPAAAVEIGEDGLHKEPWFTITFKDLAEDLETANDEGKRLALIFEQRGCIYCRKLHEEVFSIPKVADYIKDNFIVVQYNMFGDEEVTDFDGEVMTEKEAAGAWNVLFTPTIMFMPDTLPEDGNAASAAVAVMPGAFGKYTTLNMFRWVREKGYEGDEPFQKYHARMFAKEKAGE